MAKLGFRTFSEMVGHTEKLFFHPDPQNTKALSLNFDPILKNAQEMRPEVSILGGTKEQEFNMDARLVSEGRGERVCNDMKLC